MSVRRVRCQCRRSASAESKADQIIQEARHESAGLFVLGTSVAAGGFWKGVRRKALLRILVPAGIVGAFIGGVRLFDRVCDSPAEQRVFSDFKAIGSAMRSYRVDAGFYPTTDQGLEALVNRPSTEPVPEKWTKMADAVPRDYWGPPYHYRLLSQDAEPSFEITSAGKDGVFGTKDDFSSLDKER